MPQYTVRDPSTGRTVTFNWNDSTPPTDADIAEVFAAAGPMPEPKSISGFLSNVAKDLPAIPRAIKGAAELAYSASLPGMVDRTVDWAGRMGSAIKSGKAPEFTPAEQMAVNALRSPLQTAKAGGGAVADKALHPIRTAGEVADYAYEQPVQAAMDASALMAGGAGVLGLAGRAPRVAGALSKASRIADPINLAGQAVGGATRIIGSGADASGEALARKALNMSDANVRARGGAARTMLEQRIPATHAGDDQLSALMAPIGKRQATAIGVMPEFAITQAQLPSLNALVDDTSRIRGSDKPRYDAAVRQRTEALVDPNFTSDRPVIDGLAPTEGRYPAPIAGQLLHENKQALQRRAADAKAYIANPELAAEGDAVTARASDYKRILDDASPEYAAANREFSPLMELQEQLRERALHRGGHEMPYAVGMGISAARGNVMAPAAGILSALATRNPRIVSGLAQGSYDIGQGLMGVGRATQALAPQVNKMDALQRAIMGVNRDRQSR